MLFAYLANAVGQLAVFGDKFLVGLFVDETHLTTVVDAVGVAADVVREARDYQVHHHVFSIAKRGSFRYPVSSITPKKAFGFGLPQPGRPAQRPA